MPLYPVCTVPALEKKKILIYTIYTVWIFEKKILLDKQICFPVWSKTLYCLHEMCFWMQKEQIGKKHQAQGTQWNNRVVIQTVFFGLLFVSESRKNIKHGSVPTKTAHNLRFHSGQAPSLLQVISEVKRFNTLFIFVAGFHRYNYFFLVTNAKQWCTEISMCLCWNILKHLWKVVQLLVLQGFRLHDQLSV